MLGELTGKQESNGGISMTIELMMFMAFDEMPVSGCTCLLDFQLWLSIF